MFAGLCMRMCVFTCCLLCACADARKKRNSAFAPCRKADSVPVLVCGSTSMCGVGIAVPQLSAGALPWFHDFVRLRRCRTALSCCASSRPWRLAPVGLPSLTPSHLRCCALRLRCGCICSGGAGLLFPLSLHAVLAVKVGACLARWRPGGRLRTLTAALRRAASGLGQFRPESFQGKRP